MITPQQQQIMDLAADLLHMPYVEEWILETYDMVPVTLAVLCVRTRYPYEAEILGKNLYWTDAPEHFRDHLIADKKFGVNGRLILSEILDAFELFAHRYPEASPFAERSGWIHPNIEDYMDRPCWFQDVLVSYTPERSPR